GEIPYERIDLERADSLPNQITRQNSRDVHHDDAAQMAAQLFPIKLLHRADQLKQKLAAVLDGQAELTKRSYRDDNIVFRILNLERRTRSPLDIDRAGFVDVPNLGRKGGFAAERQVND